MLTGGYHHHTYTVLEQVKYLMHPVYLKSVLYTSCMYFLTSPHTHTTLHKHTLDLRWEDFYSDFLLYVEIGMDPIDPFTCVIIIAVRKSRLWGGGEGG